MCNRHVICHVQSCLAPLTHHVHSRGKLSGVLQAAEAAVAKGHDRCRPVLLVPGAVPMISILVFIFVFVVLYAGRQRCRLLLRPQVTGVSSRLQHEINININVSIRTVTLDRRRGAGVQTRSHHTAAMPLKEKVRATQEGGHCANINTCHARQKCQSKCSEIPDLPHSNVLVHLRFTTVKHCLATIRQRAVQYVHNTQIWKDMQHIKVSWPYGTYMHSYE